MDMKGYFTKQGLELSAKLSASAVLEITRVVAGSSRTQSPETAVSLSKPVQELAVDLPVRHGNTATFPVTLTASLAGAAYTLTELGIYARDPDKGEILYKLYQLSEPVAVSPESRMVLRFYLEETVSQELEVSVPCSPAGLITEEMFKPVRDRVQAASVPERRVVLAAADLQAYLDSLPRLLTEYYQLTVSGTLDTAVRFGKFYGSGTIHIVGNDFTMRNTLAMAECRVPVIIANVRFEEPEEFPTFTGLLEMSGCAFVKVNNCTFTGYEGGHAYAVSAKNGSAAVLEGMQANSCSTVALAESYSVVAISGSESDFSNNTYGAYVWHGGVVILSGSTPTLLGGSSNLKQGGLIVAPDGTLL